MTFSKHGVHVTQAHTIKWVQIAGLAVTGFLSGGTGVVAGTSLTQYRVDQLEKVNDHQEKRIDALRDQYADINLKLEVLIERTKK